ncbi:hypothetical protein FS842_003263 [Serendipita sp. 407]|nr:hypothetical protein FS842_003263 [Serendipita sp. 407]
MHFSFWLASNSYESVSSTPSHASSTSIQSTDSSVSAASTVSNTSSVGTVPGPQVMDVKGEQTAPLEASGIVEVSEEEFERAKRSHRSSARPLSPELTLRAVLLGLAVGCLIAFTNLYLGLQSGWISMMSIQSALLGRLLGVMFSKPFTAQENVVLQTTAVATGTMPLAAGFVGIIPALTILEKSKDGSDPIRFTWSMGIVWSFGVAFFGVFLAVPLRHQTIIKEKLVFPSGKATAQLISVMYREPLRKDDLPASSKGFNEQVEEDRERLLDDDESTTSGEDHHTGGSDVPGDDRQVTATGWAPLLQSFMAAAFITVLAYFFPVIFAVPLFGDYLARQWLWYFTPSLSYVGQGIIMGFSTTVSMNLGMFVGWAILSPLSKHRGWAPGPVGDMSVGARGWILWVALAVMTADSLVSIIPIVLEFFSFVSASFTPKEEQAQRRSKPSHDGEVEPSSRLIPRNWVLTGLGGSIACGTMIVYLLFGYEGIKPWATLVGFALGAVLSLLGVRALGETDLNPVSGLGKISQLFFAFLQPGNVVANIIAGGVAEAGAQQAGDLMQDFKTGHLVGASPRAQFQGQILGSFVSIFVTTTAFVLYSRTYQIPGPDFPAPTAYVWLNLARLLRSSSLPAHVGGYMTAFSLIAAVLSGVRIHLGKSRHKHWMRWIPSGVAFAVGMLNTPNFSMARLVGGLVEIWWRRRLQVAHSSHSREIEGEDEDEVGSLEQTKANISEVGTLTIVIIASGFVLGEGIGSIINLVLRMSGVPSASCWGCSKGICAGCL